MEITYSWCAESVVLTLGSILNHLEGHQDTINTLASVILQNYKSTLMKRCRLRLLEVWRTRRISLGNWARGFPLTSGSSQDTAQPEPGSPESQGVNLSWHDIAKEPESRSLMLKREEERNMGVSFLYNIDVQNQQQQNCSAKPHPYALTMLSNSYAHVDWGEGMRGRENEQSPAKIKIFSYILEKKERKESKYVDSSRVILLQLGGRRVLLNAALSRSLVCMDVWFNKNKYKRYKFSHLRIY